MSDIVANDARAAEHPNDMRLVVNHLAGMLGRLEGRYLRPNRGMNK